MTQLIARDTTVSSEPWSIRALIRQLGEEDKRHPRQRTRIGAEMPLEQWESYEVAFKEVVERRHHGADGRDDDRTLHIAKPGSPPMGTKYDDLTFAAFVQDVYPVGCDCEVEEDYFFELYEALRQVLFGETKDELRNKQGENDGVSVITEDPMAAKGENAKA